MEALRRKIEKKTNRDVLRVYRYTRSAVLLPLIRRQGEWRVLFEVRSESLKAQPGEICFPGGWVEAGEDECETAVRETCEELRVPRSSIEVWGDLGILVTPFQQILYPFVGVLLRPELVDPNPLEVAEVFSLSLDDLLAATPSYYEIPVCVCPPEEFPYEKIPGGRNYPWGRGFLPEFFYELEGRIIWGMTGRILHSFLEIVR